MNDTTEILSTNTAAVLEQSLMAFGAGMSVQSRTDVKNSYQFASLVASKLYDQEGQGEAWFKQFLKVLQDCGWVTARRSYEREFTSSKTLTVGAVASKALGAIGTAVMGGPVGVALNKLTNDALAKLGQVEQAQKLFDRNVKNKKTATIGLASCIETSDGEVVLAMSCIHSDTSAKDLDVFVLEWNSSSAEFYTGAAALSFNKPVYERVRATIESKLGDRSLGNVLDYEI
ncbi:hypothetical protein [Pseudomonas]|jgi:hypothetical protein|uniref:Uncharacterized protein n=1 Tax=Pseudomonas wadenswilerensis TaxID=1785161 RepID=A0A380T7E7_9PSED|nr:hypothetical protein [Pseudomonas]MCE5980954.1 hypothetical protein [Pseudomonas sp. LF19]UVM22512.1 hypothetical protein LOY45_02785 [Pseudomonas wadenswilerensis]SPO68884.1 conserved protein of unknown function [Pseudomonas sp. JV241A]SUQ65478.1 hypothetical protein CCOS864_04953 [Pseudomonas wadenswilerensis]